MAIPSGPVPTEKVNVPPFGMKVAEATAVLVGEKVKKKNHYHQAAGKFQHSMVHFNSSFMDDFAFELNLWLLLPKPQQSSCFLP